MARKNYTSLKEFILLGLADRLEPQVILLCNFSMIYMLTVVGNFGSILLIRADSWLHTPMYFFLAKLSFVDVCYSSIITPKMLVDFLSEKKTISFAVCFLQMYFFIALATTECILFWVNGPWLLCGHMQPSPLHLDHVQDGLPENGSRGFYSRTVELCNSPHRLCEQLVILQFQCHPSLLLWQSPTFQALLFWHMPIWKYHVHFCWCEYGQNSAGDPHLLLLHSLLHFPYAYRGGEAQSILHVCVSPGSHHPVLFHLHLYLSETFLQLLLDSGQSSFCVLHSGDPHVKSSDLQSPEQGSKEGFRMGNIYIPVADSFWYMAKPIQYCKVK